LGDLTPLFDLVGFMANQKALIKQADAARILRAVAGSAFADRPFILHPDGRLEVLTSNSDSPLTNMPARDWDEVLKQ
jgi:hypothetical protein